MRIANAPVSYGVFGSISTADVIAPADVLRAMAVAGYDGAELGPPGFLGSVEATVDAFAAAGLAGAGAYVPLRTQHGGAELEQDLLRMRVTIDELVALGGTGPLILADEGDSTLLRHPRKPASLSLDGDRWRRLVDAFLDAAHIAEDQGLSVVVHPHIATYVELPDEIDRLLDETDLMLAYDVAHIVLGGGDAVGGLMRWHDRIRHVHVKDARPEVFEAARLRAADDFDEWWSTLCTPLGQGELEVTAFMTALQSIGYDRWVVVEQDCAPATASSLERIRLDQDHNLRWLRARLGTVAGTHDRREAP